MFKLHFSTDNAAFEESAHDECAAILRRIAASLECGTSNGIIRDTNGNRIGEWSLSIEGESE